MTDEFGGYKRSSVTKLVEGLEKQRDSILAEIAKEEQRNAELVRRAQEEAAARRRAEAQNAELARRAETEAEARRRAEEESAKAQEARLVAVEKSVRESEERRLAQAQKEEEERRSENPVASFRRGDPTLALESMYTGLSMDIEKLRDDILQEMRYTYKQDMAIYDDLSSLIESVKKSDIDRAAMDESLRPIREKVETLAPVDYENLRTALPRASSRAGSTTRCSRSMLPTSWRRTRPRRRSCPRRRRKTRNLRRSSAR